MTYLGWDRLLAVALIVLALGGCASSGAVQPSGEPSAREVDFTI